MPLLRPCSGALATALATGVGLNFQADLFTITLQSGIVFNWTSAPADLVVGVTTYASIVDNAGNASIQRSKMSLTYTMEIPSMELRMDTVSTTTLGGVGGPQLRTAAINGLLDGATVLLQRVFMPTWGDTSTLGTIPLFLGDAGQASVSLTSVSLKVRGKNSRLAVNTPRNIYQPGCVHTFCDAGCTLNPATFTFSTTVTGATRNAVSLTAFPPTGQVPGGTLTITSGVAAGQPPRSIIDTTGGFTVVLAYPLSVVPAPGDSVTVFTACDKRLTTCTNVYSNTLNFLGFPFMPPPDMGTPG